MRMKTRIGWSLAFCCSAALAPAPQTAAAPDTAAVASAAADEYDADEQAAREIYERHTQAVKAALVPLYRKLRESAAPRDWMLASQLFLLSMAGNDPEFGSAARAELLRNAAAAAPEDALVQWVAMTSMPSASGGCAAPQGLPANLDAVLRLESDNGLAWLPVLSQAWRAKDALAIDSALSHMAAATRYDDHSIEYGQLAIELYRNNSDTLRELGAVAEGRAVDPVQYGLDMSRASSALPFQALIQACDRTKQPAADARRFAVCADLGQRMLREAKTTIVRHTGGSVLEKSGLSDETEVAALRRETGWLYAALDDEDSQHARRYADALQRHGDELEALRELVRARGVSPTPPPTWPPPAGGGGDDGAIAVGDDAEIEVEVEAEARADVEAEAED